MSLTLPAPERFVLWLDKNRHTDPKTGLVYRYHPRSDAHSVALCEAIVEDLLRVCPTLRDQAERRLLVYGINCKIENPMTKKRKTLDLAIGLPSAADRAREINGVIVKAEIETPLFSCEAKTVMTEHGKSKPRVYDELSSSHEIIHQGWPDAIATGITVVNIADTFVSPLRNQRPGAPLDVTTHKQPKAAGDMVRHLRGLQLRNEAGKVGFDAYASVVIECNNQKTPVKLWTESPAPQTGEVDHYGTLLARVSRFWTERFSTLRAPRR